MFDNFQKGLWVGAAIWGNFVLVLLFLQCDITLETFTTAVLGINTGFFIAFCIHIMIAYMKNK